MIWGNKSLKDSLIEIIYPWWRSYLFAIIYIIVAHKYALPYSHAVMWACIISVIWQTPSITIHNLYSYLFTFSIVVGFLFFFTTILKVQVPLIFFICFAVIDREF